MAEKERKALRLERALPVGDSGLRMTGLLSYLVNPDSPPPFENPLDEKRYPGQETKNQGRVRLLKILAEELAQDQQFAASVSQEALVEEDPLRENEFPKWDPIHRVCLLEEQQSLQVQPADNNRFIAEYRLEKAMDGKGYTWEINLSALAGQFLLRLCQDGQVFLSGDGRNQGLNELERELVVARFHGLLRHRLVNHGKETQTVCCLQGLEPWEVANLEVKAFEARESLKRP